MLFLWTLFLVEKVLQSLRMSHLSGLFNIAQMVHYMEMFLIKSKNKKTQQKYTEKTENV